MLREEEFGAPSYFYKYRGVNDYSLHILKQNEIYFNNFYDFNDPFECRFLLECDDSQGIDQKWLELLGADSKNPKEWLENNFGSVEKTILEQLANLTFCCFSAECDDILAFSHYADCHQGFCIGFDSDYSPFDHAGCVRYKHDLPKVNILKPHKSAAHDILLTKAKMWHYEKEWRIVDETRKKGWCPFPQEAICEIILGCRISPENEKKIMDIVKQKENEIEVFKAVQNKNTYALSIEDFYYHNP